MSITASIGAAVATALVLATPALPDASKQAPKEVVSIYLSTGGPTPGIEGLRLFDDGSMAIGPIGEEKTCANKIGAADLEDLEKQLKESADVFFWAWLSWHEGFDDFASVSYALPQPVGPGAGKEVEIPLEMFPARLVDLAQAIDRAEAQACGSTWWGILRRVKD